MRQAVEQVFSEEYGSEVVHRVQGVHFHQSLFSNPYPPGLIEVTVVVQTRRQEMLTTAEELRETFWRQGGAGGDQHQGG